MVRHAVDLGRDRAGECDAAGYFQAVDKFAAERERAVAAGQRLAIGDGTAPIPDLIAALDIVVPDNIAAPRAHRYRRPERVTAEVRDPVGRRGLPGGWVELALPDLLLAVLGVGLIGPDHVDALGLRRPGGIGMRCPLWGTREHNRRRPDLPAVERGGEADVVAVGVFVPGDEDLVAAIPSDPGVL